MFYSNAHQFYIRLSETPRIWQFIIFIVIEIMDDLEIELLGNEIKFIYNNQEYRKPFEQLNWFYARLVVTNHNILFPPLPSIITENLNDGSYITKKVIQIKRFFIKLVRRINLSEIENFFMKGEANIWVLPDNHVFRISPFVIDGDSAEFSRRKGYIMTMENTFTSILSSFSSLIKSREKCANSLISVSQQSLGVWGEQQLPNDPYFGVSFYEVCKKLYEYQVMAVSNFCLTKNMKFVIDFGDIILEYKQSVECLKRIMNSRTNCLNEYIDACKEREATMASTMDDTKNIIEKRKKFEIMRDSISKQLILFRKEQISEIKSALNSFVKEEINLSEQIIKECRNLLNKGGF
jgi:hypothetical protein